MSAAPSRIVVVLGREPVIDLTTVAARAVADAGGHVAVLVVGDRPNQAQAEVIDGVLGPSSGSQGTLFVHHIVPADVTDDDEVVIAANARERALLERLFVQRDAAER